MHNKYMSKYMERFKTGRKLAALVAVAAVLLMPVASYALSYITSSSTGVAYAANCDKGVAYKDEDGKTYTIDPSCNDPARNQKCKNGQCLIENYIQPALNLLAAGVGLACAVSFIMAGIRYESSADNSQKVSDAKQRIVNTIFVLIGFFTFYALMQYLVPGGIL